MLSNENMSLKQHIMNHFDTVFLLIRFSLLLQAFQIFQNYKAAIYEYVVNCFVASPLPSSLLKLANNRMFGKWKVTALRITYLCALVHAISNRYPVFLFRRNNEPTICPDTHRCNPGIIFSQIVSVVEFETRVVFSPLTKT